MECGNHLSVIWPNVKVAVTIVVSDLKKKIFVQTDSLQLEWAGIVDWFVQCISFGQEVILVPWYLCLHLNCRRKTEAENMVVELDDGP